MGKVRIIVVVEPVKRECIMLNVRDVIGMIINPKDINTVEIVNSSVDDELIALAGRSRTVTSIFLVSDRYPDGNTPSVTAKKILKELNSAAGSSDRIHALMLHEGPSCIDCVTEWPKVTLVDITDPFPAIYEALNEILNPPTTPTA